MTFILDMASGTEYQNGGIYKAPNRAAEAHSVEQHQDAGYTQLQLVSVAVSPRDCNKTSIFASPDINTLIQSIED